MFGLFKKKKKQPQAPPFWQTKGLRDMSRDEWESLCDGCGRCCLNKLEHQVTGDIMYTDVACRLMDIETCRCSNYENRKRYVPECQILTPRMIDKLGWLPSTCAYRLISEGQDLYWWHPLVSGDSETVHYAGISVRGRVVSERDTDDLENRVVGWPR